ncbi:MAG: hypothetical protein GTO62_16520 [Planctomycetales bacterium]|nr:hypothetical protein [Planctomycetales bacterium]NIP70841.1 hypothetical protein [Planctomycetales bacterium]
MREQLKRGIDWIARVAEAMSRYPEFDDILRRARDARTNGTADDRGNGS